MLKKNSFRFLSPTFRYTYLAGKDFTKSTHCWDERHLELGCAFNLSPNALYNPVFAVYEMDKLNLTDMK